MMDLRSELLIDKTQDLAKGVLPGYSGVFSNYAVVLRERRQRSGPQSRGTAYSLSEAAHEKRTKDTDNFLVTVGRHEPVNT